MRILASNPDTIGDLVLRQPMYEALRAAGHELMLVVRPLLKPLIPLVAPGAVLATWPGNVYNPALCAVDKVFDPLVSRAREFAPELLLVAPFQWTMMEERLSVALQGTRCVAMTGRLYADPAFGPPPPSYLRVTDRVEVSEDTLEVRKNELLASAVLGRAMTLPEPRLTVPEGYLRAAEAELVRLGLEPGGYWVACVGDTASTHVRNWGRWAEALAPWSRKHGRKFLLVGHSSEQATGRAVRDAMGDERRNTAEWFGLGDSDLEVLLGLIAHSGGYVGRDTGPMHLAAALAKPVLAVFGGGTWPRFIPASTKSVSLTVGVPCAGCGWQCHLEDSYCIKDVPVEAVLTAADELEAGRVTERSVRVMEPDAVLLNRIGREGAAEQERMRQLLGTARGRIAELKRATQKARAAAVRARGAVDDLKLKLARSVSDQADLNTLTRQQKAEIARLSTLTRQQEAEIVVQRDRLRDLMASRWRKLGQQLGVAMTMPWEKEFPKPARLKEARLARNAGEERKVKRR